MILPANIQSKISFLYIIVLVAVGLCIIFYQFTYIPKQTTYDEIEFTKLALSLEGKPYTPYSPLATGHATVYFYLLLFSMKLFGITLLGLRLPSALFGLCNTILIFFVLQLALKMAFRSNSSMFIQFFSFIGALLFTTTRWYFNFARFGFEGTFILFLELFSLLFLFLFAHSKQKKWLIGAGFFTGLAYNSYQPGRLFFIIPVVFLLSFFYVELKKKNIIFFRKTLSYFSSFLIPFLVLILPLTLYLFQHQDVRMYQLFYPANTEMTIEEKLQSLSKNIQSTTLMFSIRGDVSGRHNYPNKPALNPVVSLLFVVGMTLSFFRFREQTSQLFLIYFFLSLLPTLLTYPWENPNMLRTITTLPSIIYFSTISLIFIFNIMKKIRGISHFFVSIFLFMIVGISAFYDIRTYFVYQVPVFSEAFEAVHPLKYYILHPDENKKNLKK